MNLFELSVPPVPGFEPPLLARLFAPSGPPRLRCVRAGDICVVAVPGRYSVSYAIVGSEQLVIVDVGSACDVPGLDRVARWLEKPVGLILLTHLHFDHIMGADFAARHFDAPIAMSAIAAHHVEHGESLRSIQRWGMPHFWTTWLWQGAPPLAGRDLRHGLDFGFPWSRNRFRSRVGPTLDDGSPVPFAEGWRALLTPGHSDDALCLYSEAARILIAGDTVRNFLGGEWNPLYTSRRDYEATIARLAAIPVRLVLPGHGPAIMIPARDSLERLGPLQ
jgi:glyoxylase-like metal-dependent hydrolase (beta-lactamase superfamily II)